MSIFSYEDRKKIIENFKKELLALMVSENFQYFPAFALGGLFSQIQTAYLDTPSLSNERLIEALLSDLLTIFDDMELTDGTERIEEFPFAFYATFSADHEAFSQNRPN